MKTLRMFLPLVAVAALQISTAQARPGDATDWRQSRQENRTDPGYRGDATDWRIDQGHHRGDPTDWRQSRQENRIDQGYRQGDLTRGEVSRLREREHRIDGLDRRAWADGRFSERERSRMNRAFDRQSRNIHRLRHNRRRWA